MQKIVVWWCDLVGVTDPQAVSIAAGIVAGGVALALAYFVVAVAFRLLGSWART